MPHRPGVRTASLTALLLAPSLVGVLGACNNDKFKGPEAEVKKTDVKLALPDVPAFDLPAPTADGAHSVKELRVKGKKFFDTEVTVKGIVTWAYDCATAVRQPGMTDKDVAKKIEDDPTLCERAKFYLGDTADTPAEKSLWVVDVPRPFNKLELQRLPKEDLKHPPAVPPYKVGDVITVTGDWKMSSPHSERNSDGLLVYKKLHNESVTPPWDTPPPDPLAAGSGAAPGGAPPGPPPPGSKPSPEDLVKNKKPH